MCVVLICPPKQRPDLTILRACHAANPHGAGVAWRDKRRIYAYTRKDALADGVQIDVSEVAREAGLKFPVYLTRAVWESFVSVPDGVRCQDEKGRLWDIVWMLRCAARRTSGPQMLFGLHVRNDNRDRTPPLVNLKAVCGPRDIDDPQPAITVMLPDED